MNLTKLGFHKTAGYFENLMGFNDPEELTSAISKQDALDKQYSRNVKKISKRYQPDIEVPIYDTRVIPAKKFLGISLGKDKKETYLEGTYKSYSTENLQKMQSEIVSAYGERPATIEYIKSPHYKDFGLIGKYNSMGMHFTDPVNDFTGKRDKVKYIDRETLKQMRTRPDLQDQYTQDTINKALASKFKYFTTTRAF